MATKTTAPELLQIVSHSEHHLADGEVQLWITQVQDCFTHVSEEEWLASLSGEEQSRCLRARVASVRRERIITRGLIRQGLSHFSGRPPASWRVTENKLGRPEAIDADGLRFNASHSRGLVVCAFAWNRNVGVDTESFLRSVPDRAEFGRFLSPTESQRLSQASEAEYALTFFRFWTLKEAYAKARGIGISIGFREFSVELGDEDRESMHAHPRLFDRRTSTQWHLRECRVLSHHLIGLALEQIDDEETPRISLRTVSLQKTSGGRLQLHLTEGAERSDGS